MKDLQTLATQKLIAQVLANLEHAVVLGPGSRLDVLTSRYEGRLVDLLAAAYPGTPETAWHRVRGDLIVVSRNLSPPSSANVVQFSESLLRVPKGKASASVLREWQEHYSPLTNVMLKRSRYLESDMTDCMLTFDKSFFTPRSFEKWARLSEAWARQCAAMLELKRLTSLTQRELTFTDGRTTSLVPATLVRRTRGATVELDLEDCV